MRRTLPAVLILTLAACSSGGSSGTTSTVGGSTGKASGPTTGVATSGASGGSSGTTGGSGNGGNGPGGSSTGGGNGGGLTVDSFNAAFNSAVCKYELNCEEGPYAPYIATAICNSGLVLINESGLPEAVDAGRISFNVGQATTCVDGLMATTCNPDAILACEPFLTSGDGLVSPAGACYADADCLSEGCTGNDTSQCTAGTCLGLVPIGGACDCTNCGNCNPDAGLVCANSICSAPSTVGQACGGTNPDCALGLACVGSVCTTLPISAGNPCEFDNGECAAGTYCFETSSASTGNCAVQVAAGQPCSEDANHAQNAFSRTDNECAGLDSVCVGAGTLMGGGMTASGLCAPFSDVGGPCTPPGGNIDTNQSYNDGCYVGLNCVGGACVKPPSSGMCSATGVACDVTVSFCASATGNCTAYLAPGATCNPGDPSPCGIEGQCNIANDICEGKLPTCTPTL